VLARESGDEDERAFWRRAMSGAQSEEDFARAQGLLRRHHAIERTLDEARRLAAEARTMLTTIPSNAYSEALAELADFVVDRAA
jgi:octaprenyl-diphosphate synthase